MKTPTWVEELSGEKQKLTADVIRQRALSAPLNAVLERLVLHILPHCTVGNAMGRVAWINYHGVTINLDESPLCNHHFDSVYELHMSFAEWLVEELQRWNLLNTPEDNTDTALVTFQDLAELLI